MPTSDAVVISIPSTKLNIPSRISAAIPTAKPPTQRAIPDAAVTIADNAFHNAFPMSFNVITISSIFLDCYRFIRIGRVGSNLFSFRLSVCPKFPCAVFDRIGRFRFGGFSKVGIRGCKVCRTKYYLSLRGWRFFQTTAKRLDLAAAYYPGITFAPATKMTY